MSKVKFDKLYTYSEKAKIANNYEWYKVFAEHIMQYSVFNLHNANDRYRKTKINFDLYNGKLDKDDIKREVFETFKLNDEFDIDRNFMHTDIISPKIKVLEGMENMRGFPYKVIAINEEATTRKEKKKFELYLDFVRNAIMSGVRKRLQEEFGEQLEQAKQEGNQQMLQQLQMQIKQREAELTPPEIETYMAREHQDPAEVLAQQLLSYLKNKLRLQYKFNLGWKYGLISAVEVYYVSTYNNEPYVEAINPLYFDFGGLPTGEYRIEKAQWAIALHNMTLNEIVEKFGSQLSDKQIDELTQWSMNYSFPYMSFIDTTAQGAYYLPVFHVVWKALRKIGFLKYIDEATGEVMETIVTDDYKIKPEYGDISIEWRWIPEVYYAWRVGYTDVWLDFGIVPQAKDFDNIYEVNLPYVGIIYDAVNSNLTSIVDRLKPHQYLYDIILNKLRQLILSDKGKMLLMNINMIPESKGIDLEKWFEYTRIMGIGFFNPYEEGNKITDINAAAKQIDMSLISDIQKYIQILDYLDEKAGESVGISRQVIGQVKPREPVGTTQLAFNQSVAVLEPYFMLHNNAKKQVLEQLLNVAKVTYSKHRKKKLSFILDDLSKTVLELDTDLLEESSYGIFISDSIKWQRMLDYVNQIAMAAMQNQLITLSDYLKVIKSDSMQEAIETLEKAEREYQQRQEKLMQQQQQMQQQLKQQELEAKLREIAAEGQFDLEKEKMRGENRLRQQTILALGFDEDKDRNKNNIPDVLEYYKLLQQQQKQEFEQAAKAKELELKEKELEIKKQKAENKAEENTNKNDNDNNNKQQ